jgi:hypothetical protein
MCIKYQKLKFLFEVCFCGMGYVEGTCGELGSICVSDEPLGNQFIDRMIADQVVINSWPFTQDFFVPYY